MPIPLSFRHVLYCMIGTLCHGSLLAQDSIQSLVDQALQNGTSEVTIPPGTYRTSQTLFWQNRSDVTINAYGVTLVLEERRQALSLRNCTNFSIKGLTIDLDPLPFTQATITGHAGDWSTVDAVIHDGYPRDPETSGTKVEVYRAADRLLVPDVWTAYGATVTMLSASTIRVTGLGGFNGRVSVGDKLVLDCPGIIPHGVVIDKCTNTSFEDVTLHASTSFGFFETECSGNRYLGIRIVPGPPPIPGGEPRLRSLNADGIHSKHATVGPTIEHCTITSNGDDGVAINGDFDVVIATSGNTVTLCSKGEVQTEVGDTVRSFSQAGVLNFESVVTAREAITGDTTALQTILDGLSLHNPGQFDDFYRLTLTDPISAPAGSLICPVNRKGNGFAVRNNYIANKRARGILIKAEDGLIEGNTIEWNHMGAIVIAPEVYWMESGYSRNMVIRNNTIRNCNLNPSNPGTGQAGVITVSADAGSGFAPAGGHRTIEVTGNRIEGCLGVNILATSISGLTISGNTMTDTHSQPRTHGANRGVDTNATVSIINCDAVTLGQNWVSPFPGPGVLQTSHVTDLTGAHTFTAAPANPTPTLSAVAPSHALLNSASFTMTLTGTNFVSTSRVRWSGRTDLVPDTFSSTRLTVSVPASYLKSLGPANLSVVNMGPGGGTSAGQIFTVSESDSSSQVEADEGNRDCGDGLVGLSLLCGLLSMHCAGPSRGNEPRSGRTGSATGPARDDKIRSFHGADGTSRLCRNPRSPPCASSCSSPSSPSSRPQPAPRPLMGSTSAPRSADPGSPPRT